MPAVDPAPQLVPNPKLNNYERTTQSFFFTRVAANQAQVGTLAPVNANIYGMVGTVARGQLPFNIAVQVDVGGTGGLSAGLTVVLLGSLDGTNFYPIATFTPAVTGGLFNASGIIARYLTASISGFAVASGAPTVSVSFSE